MNASFSAFPFSYYKVPKNPSRKLKKLWLAHALLGILTQEIWAEAIESASQEEFLMCWIKGPRITLLKHWPIPEKKLFVFTFYQLFFLFISLLSFTCLTLSCPSTIHLYKSCTPWDTAVPLPQFHLWM